MSSELWAAIIGGGAGLLTGALSALVAPWAKWQVDKKRIQLEHRSVSLKLWRDGLASYRQFGLDPTTAGWYQQLRPLLTNNAKAMVEQPRIPVTTSGERRAVIASFAVTLTEEIDRIEREWKLNK